MRGGGYSTRRLPLFYVMWMVSVGVWGLLTRPRRVHALGFETAFPLAVVKRLIPRVHVVYDDADRFSQSFPMPSLARRAISALERWTARTVDVHVVPNTLRYADGLSDRAVVVPNVPTADIVERAKNIEVEAPVGDGLTIYVNGWLGASRGAHMLADAAEVLGAEVRFLVAGRISDDAARRFTSQPNVQYLGVVANDVALAQYRVADLTVTLYDPALRINRLAEANKWGDCLVTGTPFVVNAEVETARTYLEKGCAVAVPFGDSTALVAAIRRLALDDDALVLMASKMKTEGRDVVGFETVYNARVVTKILAAT